MYCHDENIRHLIGGVAMSDSENETAYGLVEEYRTYVHIFGSTMELRIFYELDGRLIVLVEGDWFEEFDADFLKALAEE